MMGIVVYTNNSTEIAGAEVEIFIGGGGVKIGSTRDFIYYS